MITELKEGGNIIDEAYSFYEDEISGYILNAEKTFIKIKMSGWDGNTNVKVTIQDIIEYYRYEVNNISSRLRNLVGHYGVWRPIDNLAKECLKYFKFVNINKLRSVSKKYELIPKF